MSETFVDTIFDAFADTLKDGSKAAVPAAAETVLATPGLEKYLAEHIERAVARFAEDEMGVPPALRFGDEFEFFDKYLTPAYETGGASQSKGWCARWFEHRSVRVRIRAMWQHYEVLARTDPGNCDERFLREVGDHHMDRLTSERSPMNACQIKHQPSKTLQTTPADHAAPTEGELS